MVLISNAMLIYTLRQRQKLFMMQQTSVKSESHFNGAQSRTEHKVSRPGEREDGDVHVTITVCAIVTCFTITQGPSALITIMSDVLYYPIHHEWMVAVVSGAG